MNLKFNGENEREEERKTEKRKKERVGEKEREREGEKERKREGEGVPLPDVTLDTGLSWTSSL